MPFTIFAHNAFSFIYISIPSKINPPMDNVTKKKFTCRNGWCFWRLGGFFFANKELNEANFELEEFKYLDKYFSKEEALRNSESHQVRQMDNQQIQKSNESYCQLNGFIFNPKILHTSNSRITKNIKGKTQEVFYIRTIEQTAVITEGVTEYKSEEDILINPKTTQPWSWEFWKRRT